MLLVGGMPEDVHRKRRKGGFRFSSQKQLEKAKMVRRLQRISTTEVGSIVRSLSFEDHGARLEDFKLGDVLPQSSDGMNIAKLDDVDEGEAGVLQSLSSTHINFVSSSICC